MKLLKTEGDEFSILRIQTHLIFKTLNEQTTCRINGLNGLLSSASILFPIIVVILQKKNLYSSSKCERKLIKSFQFSFIRFSVNKFLYIFLEIATKEHNFKLLTLLVLYFSPIVFFNCLAVFIFSLWNNGQRTTPCPCSEPKFRFCFHLEIFLWTYLLFFVSFLLCLSSLFRQALLYI